MSLAQEFDQMSSRKKTHRGRRSKGKGAKDHHEQAKAHMANAQKAPTPEVATSHLFKALSSLNKAKKQAPIIEPAAAM